MKDLNNGRCVGGLHTDGIQKLISNKSLDNIWKPYECTNVFIEDEVKLKVVKYV